MRRDRWWCLCVPRQMHVLDKLSGRHDRGQRQLDGGAVRKPRPKYPTAQIYQAYLRSPVTSPGYHAIGGTVARDDAAAGGSAQATRPGLLMTLSWVTTGC